MSTRIKAIAVNTGLGLLGLYGTLGVVFLYGFILIPWAAPIATAISVHFLLIPVAALFMMLIVVVPLALLAFTLIVLTGKLHRLIGLECCS